MAMYKGLARIYDLLKDDEQYRIWPGYILELLDEYGCRRSAEIIDAACGTGDMAITLRNAGYKLTGIDISEDMLQIALDKARLSGADIRFVRQDIKNLSVHKAADAIICANDGVNYLQDACALRSFLKSAKQALKPNGLLLFDISSRHKLEAMAGQVYTCDTDDIAYIWSNALSADGKSLCMDITFFIMNKHGSFDRYEEKHVQRIYDEDEIKDSLAGEGFLVEAVYACFSHAASVPSDQRLQFVARAVG